MSTNSYKVFFSVLAVLGALGAMYGSTVAWPSANVGLTRFEAVPLDNAVRLEWDTETELETAGFRLKRGQNQDFDYLKEAGTNNPLFLSSQGGPATGASYAFTDETAVNGESYVYQLVEVEVTGYETIQAESEVLVGLVPTDTPIVLTFGGGGSEENSVAVTATATPTEPATIAAAQTAPAASATQIASVATSPALQASSTPAANQVAEPTTVVAAVDTLPPQPTTVVPVSAASANSGPRPAVALAQEDPDSYPVEEPTPTLSAGVDNQQGVDVPPETVVTALPGDAPQEPAIIGATAYPVGPAAPAANPVLQNPDSTSSASVVAGRVYLWVGFLAALVIFAAAVLGAILLYTRRRSKD